ncbi:cation diffusion facilitator family transporter [Lactobacillus kalixensis]|uniref:Cation efflux system protein n=1 Tax=Lactobacillus kalixensis DSM 16043 TaxID=1423763 RepID=A0A0R1UCM6_9LACO|nr:cation diffusion facilitator family transporter [Lactobacillus kalixensis]KRL91183.1 cation efflux system protein [Lactobacillus kalixensis DSM 16043]
MKENSSVRYLIVTVFNIIITVAEFIGGFMSGSLALISDAVHNLSDVGSIILAFIANLIARRQKNTRKTFGYERAETLAAFTNGIILIVISIYLFIEAIQRFSNPEPIQGKIMFIVSLIGLAGNVISMLVMMIDTKGSLNARALFLNMASDALSSIAVVVGSIVISIWNITIIDPILTLLASVLLLWEAIKVTMKAANILMEGNPDIDLNKVNAILTSFAEVKNVHHVHVWQYSDDIIMLDAHINVSKSMQIEEIETLYGQIEKKLKKELGIRHVTLQAECERGKNEKMIVPGKND